VGPPSASASDRTADRPRAGRESAAKRVEGVPVLDDEEFRAVAETRDVQREGDAVGAKDRVCQPPAEKQAAVERLLIAGDLVRPLAERRRVALGAA